MSETTGIEDVVGRQTRSPESLGVLEAEGQRHRPTEAGAPPAAALDDGRSAEAQSHVRTLFAAWAFADRVVGIARRNPLAEDALGRQVEALAVALRSGLLEDGEGVPHPEATVETGDRE